jgi:D-arabinose 1-dehydrogenase-like Zn-dependent alcohol dehydrogenase
MSVASPYSQTKMMGDSVYAETPVRAYAAHGPRQALQPWAFDPGPLGEREIDLAVTHCGICHTDVHLHRA